MDVSCSRRSTEENEYNIPPMEQWRHAKCTVRARHYLFYTIGNTAIIAGLWRKFKEGHTTGATNAS